MRLRVTNWIVAAVRRNRVVPTLVTPDAPPLDHERVVQVGDALQSCYPERDEALDDGLTALMLRLTVEPPPPAPRQR